MLTGQAARHGMRARAEAAWLRAAPLPPHAHPRPKRPTCRHRRQV